MKATIKVGRFTSLRTTDGEEGEMLVVAVELGREPTVAQIINASHVVEDETKRLVSTIPTAKLFGVPRLRTGWSIAVVQEIVAPFGEGARRGFKAQRSKL